MSYFEILHIGDYSITPSNITHNHQLVLTNLNLYYDNIADLIIADNIAVNDNLLTITFRDCKISKTICTSHDHDCDMYKIIHKSCTICVIYQHLNHKLISFKADYCNNFECTYYYYNDILTITIQFQYLLNMIFYLHEQQYHLQYIKVNSGYKCTDNISFKSSYIKNYYDITKLEITKIPNNIQYFLDTIKDETFHKNLALSVYYALQFGKIV